MSQIIYEINSLKKDYAHKVVLDINHLQIEKGEILGIVGANGSGKSTLLRHLSFLESADSGEIYYKGELNPSLELKREISILLPEPYLLKRSVKENLLFGLKAHKINCDFNKRVNEALELVGLLPQKFLNRSWSELSSGETQRVAFASRLVLKPKILLQIGRAHV